MLNFYRLCRWWSNSRRRNAFEETVGPNVGVKASGGIRDRKTAQAMVRAGANRLGCSAGVAIVTEKPKPRKSGFMSELKALSQKAKGKFYFCAEPKLGTPY